MFLHWTPFVVTKDLGQGLGNEQIVTSPYKWSTGSMSTIAGYYPGNFGGVYYPLYQTISGDFTMEGWFYFNQTYSPPQTNAAFMTIGPYSVNITVPTTASPYNPTYFTLSQTNPVSSNQPYTNGSGTVQFPANTWTWIALVRNSGSLRFYVNGTNDYNQQVNPSSGYSTVPVGSTTYLDTTAAVTGGFNGYTNDYRISNVSRYSGNSVSTPSSAFTKDANTVVLAPLTTTIDNQVT